MLHIEISRVWEPLGHVNTHGWYPVYAPPISDSEKDSETSEGVLGLETSGVTAAECNIVLVST